MNSEQHQILQVYFLEYEKLKGEQTQRIGFRDNILYVTLALFGGVLSFALTQNNGYALYALLVIPWICFISGWTYLVNDEKISAIGRYIRLTLVENVKEETGYPVIIHIFGWEIAHRDDPRRKRRKIEQLLVDEITFVISGLATLAIFWVSHPDKNAIEPFIYILGGVEAIALIILGVEIWIYADLAKGR